MTQILQERAPARPARPGWSGPDTAGIEAQARATSPARVLATVLTLIPWTLGWLAGWVWLGVAWMALAARAGYRDARTGTRTSPARDAERS